jgi:hypothetical protein
VKKCVRTQADQKAVLDVYPLIAVPQEQVVCHALVEEPVLLGPLNLKKIRLVKAGLPDGLFSNQKSQFG